MVQVDSFYISLLQTLLSKQSMQGLLSQASLYYKMTITEFEFLHYTELHVQKLLVSSVFTIQVWSVVRTGSTDNAVKCVTDMVRVARVNH